MSAQNFKVFGIILLVTSAISIFVAVERYENNAQNVAAMNSLNTRAGFGGGLFGVQGDLEPATPTATKYAILFAVVFGVGGFVCLGKAAGPKNSGKPSGL